MQTSELASPDGIIPSFSSKDYNLLSRLPELVLGTSLIFHKHVV